MTRNEFWTAVEKTLQSYDLLTHPFYQAWTAGRLTRSEIGFYGRQYLYHVAAFPTYLTALHCRLEEGGLRRAILVTAADEEVKDRPHAALWRQFANGLEPRPVSAQQEEPLPEVRQLVETYRNLARYGMPSAALGAFYAYESQMPQISEEKLRGLRSFYAADERSCEYFALHRTADLEHTDVWRVLLDHSVTDSTEDADGAFDGVCLGAKALWHALDGIDHARHHLGQSIL